MTGATDPALRLALAELAVRGLQSRYADVVTRRAWPELVELFRPDAEVEIDTVDRDPFHLVGPQAVGEFIGGAIERFDFFEFVILNAVVDVDPAGGAATSRTFMCELRQEAATGRATTAYGMYRDRYVEHDGRWWFAARRYRSLARTSLEPGGPDLRVLPRPDL